MANDTFRILPFLLKYLLSIFVMGRDVAAIGRLRDQYERRDTCYVLSVDQYSSSNYIGHLRVPTRDENY